MHNSNIPSHQDLPSSQSLIKSTIIAAVTSLVLLVTVVMPSEYGIDPTGVGSVLGLKKMGEIKVSLAEELAADQAAEQAAATAGTAPVLPVTTAPASTVENPQPAQVESLLSKAQAATAEPEAPAKPAVRDTVTFSLAPNQGVEIKAIMKEGEQLTYKWVSDGGKTNFDVHGDSQPLAIDYHNYEKGSVKVKEGTIQADFDGSHGWFWRNRTGEALNITLEVWGEYETLKRVK
ncbi:hypothetical protein [Kiloniella sp. b19]|uniref:hypothetical protein n=1 Tax=Kiloniella sp. GXU_MW_B19 TaxID=3141326 RepID=UPI0031DCFF9D